MIKGTRVIKAMAKENSFLMRYQVDFLMDINDLETFNETLSISVNRGNYPVNRSFFLNFKCADQY
jgi:hypothetical protein